MRTRHVWARPEHQPTEMPGLVLGWQQQAGGAWEALVTYVTPQDKIITEWLPADRLRPVPSAPRVGSMYD